MAPCFTGGPISAPISDLIVKLRKPLMGELIATGSRAPIQLARLLETGVHVGMLVDQHFTKGVEVIFFGRRCIANPLIAMMARQTECPIHGLRVVRLADGNSFRGEITEAITPARDTDGRIDIARHYASNHGGGRRLGARISRAMALAAPAMALNQRFSVHLTPCALFQIG